MVKRQQDNKLDSLRDRLLQLKENRAKIKALQEENADKQPELVSAVDLADPNGAGIVVDPADVAYGTAYAQQNEASQFWDMENLMTWLRKPTPKQKALWMQVSSRVFDLKKFEAEIANGNIPATVVQKYKKTGQPPTPFIRFGKAKRESL